MRELPLKRETILDAAEIAMRKYGPEKTGVVDVAKLLNISHGSIYRHFDSKSELQIALAERWLGKIYPPLSAVLSEEIGAVDKLKRWFKVYLTEKEKMAKSDPELFEMHQILQKRTDGVLMRHREALIQQVAVILREGVAEGTIETEDAYGAAQNIILATTYFRHPQFMKEWNDLSSVNQMLEQILNMFFYGLVKRP